MEEGARCKQVLVVQANKYNMDRAHCRINECNSPMWEIFNVAQRLDLLDNCFNMILNRHVYPKKEWNKIVWEKVWGMEDEEIQIVRGQLRKEKLLLQVLDKPYYLNWWIMSDISRLIIEHYEIMARLVCDTNLLKSCNLRYEGTSIASRFCYACDLGIEENTNHIVMQCPASENDKQAMFNELNKLDNPEVNDILSKPAEVFLCLMGKHPEDISFDSMYALWTISAKYISGIYKRVTKDR